MSYLHSRSIRPIKLTTASLLIGSWLAACGGGSATDSAVPTQPITPPVATPTPSPTPVPVPVPEQPTPIPPVPPVAGATITSVKINSLTLNQESNVPITFGQLFKEGALLKTDGLVGKLENGTVIPLQLNIKTTHADGSIKHAIISAVMPSVPTSALTLILAKTTAHTNGTPSTAQQLLNKGFKAAVSINLGGVTYKAEADKAILSANAKTWIVGDVATEWVFSAPLTDSAGNEHPHLHVQYAVRYYDDIDTARVDFTIENTWAYEANPQNYQYDVTLSVGEKEIYNKAGLTHYHHARWRKLGWWGVEPKAHIAHDGRYLIDTRALPNYDPTVVISQQALTTLKNNFTGTATEPMRNGLAVPYMPTTGGRQDIGLLPGWAVSYLLTMDASAKNATLGTADLSGSWSNHYRDKKTGRPIDLYDYPYMTVLGRSGDTYNPATKKYEAFPACGGTCTNPHAVDTSHAPNFAYLPYIVTGDYYYLEELQFTAMYDSFSSNPGYRQNIKGLVHPDQVRGQAWSLRIIGEAGYITPDDDPMKAHFQQIVENNIAWYDENYTTNPAPSAKLGALTHGYAVVYNNNQGLGPWQDDFFTSSVGHLVDLGYTKAKPLLAWKSKFPVERMTATGMCWISAAMYSMNIKDSLGNYYADWSQIYQASLPPLVTSTACASAEMGKALEIKQGEMSGYSYSNTGMPSNMQPALAYSVDAGHPNAAQAWSIFMKRTTLPDYQHSAQFAIVPRK